MSLDRKDPIDADTDLTAKDELSNIDRDDPQWVTGPDVASVRPPESPWSLMTPLTLIKALALEDS